MTLEQQQQDRGTNETDQRRQQQCVTDFGGLAPINTEVPSRPRIIALATPTPMIEPINVCELDAGKPK